MPKIIKRNIFIFVLMININSIVSDNDQCTTIEHCAKCPKSDMCDECEAGYTPDLEHKKCNSIINSFKSSSSSSSNKSLGSIFNLTKKLREKYNTLYIIIALIFCALIVILIIFFVSKKCSKKKDNKPKKVYYYDESVNPLEKTSIVYIK